MSQTEPDPLQKYRGTSGSEVKTADIASDDHALKSIAENDGQERIYDATLAGARFVDFYDDKAAAIREMLSNAETACIRRAKAELRNIGYSDDDIPSNVTEMLELAKEEANYEPLIEVTYNRKPDATRLIIEDNGIGISTEEYQVVQRVGYSASHDNGERLGNFGIGWMSMFGVTGVNGVFKMFTKSYLTNEAYGTAEYVANFEMLDAEPDDYGTRFEFPGFGEAAKQIDIPSKVEEFSDGMVITVLYRDFDSSGQETHRSDDFLPTRMEDDYDDDAPVVIYEDEFFKAVMSPNHANNRRGVLTYNISMPIRRNEDTYGTDLKFDAPWQWDYRGKREDGPIVSCPSDEDIVGLIPKEDSKYDGLLPELQEKCIPMSDVPDDAIVMPQPASSRDSFKSGHDAFWKYVGECVNKEWAKVAKQHFEGLDSWDDFTSLDRADKQALFRAYEHFGPNGSKNDPDNIQETLEDAFGLTIPVGVCERLERSRSKVRVVSRGSNRPQTKRSCWSKKIWEVIHEAPDGVYVAKSPSKKKCEIAWGLGDTHVIRVKSYGKYEKDWGWEKLKDLPSRNLKEKLPNLDQSVIDKYEGSGGSSGSSYSRGSSGGNGRDPTTYSMKIRVSSGTRDCYAVRNAESIKESLENDEKIKIRRYGSGKYLVIRPDSESARAVAKHSNRSKGVGATRVPQYVYDYLKGTKNVYESYSELKEDKIGAVIDVNGTDMTLDELTSEYCLISACDKFKNKWTAEELAGLMGWDKDSYTEYAYIDPTDFNDSWGASTKAKVVAFTYGAGTKSFGDFNDWSTDHTSFDELYKRDALDGVDLSDEEHEALFGYKYGNPSGDTLRTLCDIAARLAERDDDQ